LFKFNARLKKLTDVRSKCEKGETLNADKTSTASVRAFVSARAPKLLRRHDGLGASTGVLVPREGRVGPVRPSLGTSTAGVSATAKGVRGLGEFAFKILLSGAMSTESNSNRTKCRWGTDWVQGFTDPGCPPLLAPPLNRCEVFY